MTKLSLKLETLETRTLLAADLGEAYDGTLDPADTEALPEGATFTAEAAQGEPAAEHEHHSMKHKLSEAAHELKDKIDHTADKVKAEAIHQLDKALEKTGNAIRSSETATKVANEAIHLTEKVLLKIT